MVIVIIFLLFYTESTFHIFNATCNSYPICLLVLIYYSGIVPWASGFVFSLRVRLQNTIEDSLAAVFVIKLPQGIQFINSVSFPPLIVSVDMD